MKTLLSVYGINAFAFLSNLAAIFVFLTLAGHEGYGSYGIYIVFLAIYYLWDISLVKTALYIRAASQQEDLERPLAFINGSLVPFIAGSAVLISIGNLLYPPDPTTGIGGQYVLMVVAAEHLLSYPLNFIIYRLTVSEKFRTIYLYRLAATLLRHGFAWGALLLTGSVFWAITAILAKGVIVGLVSLLWIARNYSVSSLVRMTFRIKELGTVASFFLAASILVVMQELPSFYIDRIYGREALGQYRTLYDIVAVVWFLAAVYPTLLFSHLLSEKTAGNQNQPGASFSFLSDRLAIFHAMYFFGISALIATERLVLGRYFAETPYALFLVAGISLLGYCRFLIEAAQANGRGRHVLGATIATSAIIAAILIYWPPMPSLVEIGWSWLLGQTFFFIALKVILLRVPSLHANNFRDVAILALPILFFIVIQDAMSSIAFITLSVFCSIVALTALIILLRRGEMPTRT